VGVSIEWVGLARYRDAIVVEVGTPIKTAWNLSCSFFCLKSQLARNYLTGKLPSGIVQVLPFHRSIAALLRSTDMVTVVIKINHNYSTLDLWVIKHIELSPSGRNVIYCNFANMIFNF
jgi:hypothetical protein